MNSLLSPHEHRTTDRNLAVMGITEDELFRLCEMGGVDAI